jgi:hypothetical protein
LNLPQTSNNAQCIIVTTNYPLSLTFRNLLEYIFLFHTGIAFKMPPIYTHHLIFQTFINTSSRQVN